MKTVILIPPNRKAMAILSPLAESLKRDYGISAMVRRDYVPCDLLMVYGAGNPQQWPIFERHVNSGRAALNWDAAYWQRGFALKAQQHFRVSINGVHPTIEHMDAAPADQRFDQYGIHVARQRHHGDHVLLIGLGHKSRRALGYRGTQWEEGKLAEIRQATDLPVIYRPKCREHHLRDENLPGCKTVWYKTTEIGSALANADLVVCRHSNVAVDAAVAGVPCVTEAGAGHWLWHDNALRKYELPPYDRRLEFLRRVSHWQWSITEAQRGDCWPLLMSLTVNPKSLMVKSL